MTLGVVACGTAGSSDFGPGKVPCPEVVFDGGGGIPDAPNGAAACPAGECNYQSQEGCAPDEACRPGRSPDGRGVAPGCRPSGTGVAGDACTQWADECATGHFCLDGVCRRLCCGKDWSACDEGESCIRQLEVDIGGDVTSAGVDLCFPVNDCDVFDPDACADRPGRVCRIVDPTGNVACAPPSDLGLGDACDTASQCGAGLHCVDRACRRLCRAEECGEPACPSDEGICVHFDRDPPGVGECTPGWD